MPIEYSELEETLKSAFPDGQIVITDLAGDNDHWQVEIRSSLFEGKSRIQQHKIVQEAVSEKDIHALSIKTQTL